VILAAAVDVGADTASKDPAIKIAKNDACDFFDRVIDRKLMASFFHG
jgi:hypothetical protein